MRNLRRMAAVVAVVFAACGGGDGVDPEEDRAAARAAMEALEERLREDGFESAPDDDEDDDDDLDFESEECRRFAEAFPEDDEELPGETASEEAEFERGELDPSGGTEETVTAAVGLVEDEEPLRERFALYGDERLAGCLEEAMRSELDAQAAEQADDDVAVQVTDLRVEEQDLDLGDAAEETAAFTVDAVLAAAGFEFPFRIEFGVARSGRAAAMVVLSTIGGEGSLDSEELLPLLLDEVDQG